jgi:hypothetical protein
MAVKHLASQAKYIFAHHDDIVAFPVLIEPEGYPRVSRPSRFRLLNAACVSAYVRLAV